eukprot:6196564-Pleurochrysis_carterae.AAC.3
MNANSECAHASACSNKHRCIDWHAFASVGISYGVWVPARSLCAGTRLSLRRVIRHRHGQVPQKTQEPRLNSGQPGTTKKMSRFVCTMRASTMPTTVPKHITRDSRLFDVRNSSLRKLQPVMSKISHVKRTCYYAAKISAIGLTHG